MFAQEPLAYRMRPRTIDEVVGQDDVIGPHTALYRMIKMDMFHPCYFTDSRASVKHRSLMRLLER